MTKSLPKNSILRIPKKPDVEGKGSVNCETTTWWIEEKKKLSLVCFENGQSKKKNLLQKFNYLNFGQDKKKIKVGNIKNSKRSKQKKDFVIKIFFFLWPWSKQKNWLQYDSSWTSRFECKDLFFALIQIQNIFFIDQIFFLLWPEPFFVLFDLYLFGLEQQRFPIKRKALKIF